MVRCSNLHRIGRVSLFPLLFISAAYALYNLFEGSLPVLKRYDRQEEYRHPEHKSSATLQHLNYTAPKEKVKEIKTNDDKVALDLSEIQKLLRRFDEQLSKHDRLIEGNWSRPDREPQQDGKVKDTVAVGEQLPTTTLVPLLDFSKEATKERRTNYKPPDSVDDIVLKQSAFASPRLMPDPYYTKSSCPKTIASIAQYSTWFKQRFRPWVKLFVDDEDVVDETNFKTRTTHYLPFGFRGTNREEMLKILRFENFTNAPLNKPNRCMRCAVVGNGGVLNGSYAGKEIDSHDLIFRLNRVKTEERYTRDIGEKTNFYLFYPESQNVFGAKDPNAVFLFAAFKGSDIIYFEHMIMGTTPFLIKNSKGQEVKRSTPKMDPTRIKLLHPDFLRYVFANFLDAKKSRPTTGAMLALLGIHLCDEVDMYGFGYDPRFTLHYFDSRFIAHTNASTGCHDVDNEKELWKKLHDEGVVRFFKRDI